MQTANTFSRYISTNQYILMKPQLYQTHKKIKFKPLITRTHIWLKSKQKDSHQYLNVPIKVLENCLKFLGFLRHK